MNIEFDRLFTPRVFAGALFVAAALSVLTYFWITWSAPPSPNVTGLLAIVTDIPVPSRTPIPNSTPTIDPYASLATATLGPGEFAIGEFVQISGTQGEGLRIRSDPGLTGKQLFLGFDTEAYTIMDGPVEVDGYSWYSLAAVNDTTRTGWAASNFLTPIIKP